jgi:hypothetical protein
MKRFDWNDGHSPEEVQLDQDLSFIRAQRSRCWKDLSLCSNDNEVYHYVCRVSYGNHLRRKYRRTNKESRGKQRGIKNPEESSKGVTAECFYRGPVLVWSGFPLKACGNDGFLGGVGMALTQAAGISPQ